MKAFFSFIKGVAYDLEGLGAATRQANMVVPRVK
jgi:hypothetical protein